MAINDRRGLRILPEADGRRGRPPGKFTQHRRMSELRQLLHQHPKGVTLSEIAGHLAVTPRSARRYLRELKLDLEATPDRPGGQKRWRIPAIDLPRRISVRRTQAYALLAARPLFDAMEGSTLFEEIDLAAQTLLGVARRPGRGPNGGFVEAKLEERFRYVPFAPKNYQSSGEDLDNLFQAVADLRPLRARYPGAEQGKLERLTLHPYALLLYKDAIHCIARDERTEQVQAYMLDLLQDTRCVVDERFALPEDFAVEDYIQGQFGLWRSAGPTHQVVIQFDASVSDYAISRTVHPSQQIEVLADGGARMHLSLGELADVTSWVLGFGSRAQVIAPPELRRQVAEELRRASAIYGDG